MLRHGLCPQIMLDTVKDPGIKRCCLIPNRLTDLQNLSDGLERCQKSLNDYLDSKRNAFPRFFFISDDELLSILGSSEPSCVQEHMIKVLRVNFLTSPMHVLPFLWEVAERWLKQGTFNAGSIIKRFSSEENL